MGQPAVCWLTVRSDWMQVQMDIREGHAVTVDKVLRWITEDGSVKGVSVCDAGRRSCLALLPMHPRSVRRLAPSTGILDLPEG